MKFHIRPAHPADITALMTLRTEAERWLQTHDTDQWSDPETGSRAIDRWHASITAGMTWIVTPSESPDTIAATVTRGPFDSDFWRPSDEPESALYLYKMIVARHFAGQNLGGLILDWASRLAELEARRWLRLDVWRTNTQLQDYYEARGFTHVRTENPAHRLSGWLAQRPAGLVLTPQTRLTSGTPVLPTRPRRTIHRRSPHQQPDLAQT